MSFAAIELEIIRAAEAHGTLADSNEKRILILAADLFTAIERDDRAECAKLIGDLGKTLIVECARLDVNFVECLNESHTRKPHLEVVA